MPSKSKIGKLPLILLSLIPFSLTAAESPYFITYDQSMEEPGALEVSINPVVGKPDHGNLFLGSTLEFEYGAKAWWTTEFYLDGQSTQHEGTLFTGFRWENRLRPFAGKHLINPVLYVEYENLSGADKTLKEVVGFDSQSDIALPNAQLHAERSHEIETKLILGSNVKRWNIAENFVAEKNLNAEPWEFGYTLGLSRPLAFPASSSPCIFCRRNFNVGIELYGGLGEQGNFGFAHTSQYVAPALAWELPNETTLKISPTFGLNHNSQRFLFRFGVSHEFEGFGEWVSRLFR